MVGVGRQRGLTALLLLLALVHTAAARKEKAQKQLAKPLPADESSIITNSTMAAIFKRVATPKENAILFNTFMGMTDSADKPAVVSDQILETLLNFCYYLELKGLMRHTLLITRDESSWRQARQAGLPAYLDKASPLGELNHGVYLGRNRIDVIEKLWLAARMLEQGHSTLFMDSDLVVVGDLLKPFHNDYDIQGLSDWREAELVPTGANHVRLCSIYILTREERVEQRSIVRAWFRDKPNHSIHYNISTPCQSTGLWYVHPTPQTVNFMNAVTHRVYWVARYQWEQAAWNDIIMSFLWGNGDEPPIRYRILPLRQFSNIEVYDLRKEAGLPVDPVVLHAGNLHGPAKIKALKRLELWHPTKFRGADVVQQGQLNGGDVLWSASVPDMPQWWMALLFVCLLLMLVQRRRAVKRL